MGRAIAQSAPTTWKANGGYVALAMALAPLLVLAVCDLNRLALIVLVTVPMATLVLVHVRFGLYCLLAYASLIAFLIRMMPPGNSGPIGLALDVLLLLMGLRLLVDLAQKRDWKVLATPLTPLVLSFVCLQVLEVFNPAAPSLTFGLFGLRVTARILVFFLIVYYFRSARAISRLLGFWLSLMLALGLYGIFQHHHGLLWQEMTWLLNEGNAKTHILAGYVRVFSTVGDAATFGFLMIMGSLMLYAMALSARGARQVGLLLLSLPMLYGMVVSYSRGCVIGLAAGAFAMIVASRNTKLALSVVAVGALGLALLVGTGSSQLVDRLSTATNPTEDASFQVRMGYVGQYLPEIAKRPFGYGINTSGGNGLSLSGGEAVRDSVIGVPTDNYYFKVALEMGWVGLALFVTLHVAVLVQAYRVYRRAKSPDLKAVALGLLSVLFALFVGAASNDLHAQKPIAEFFWVAVGLLMAVDQLRPTEA